MSFGLKSNLLENRLMLNISTFSTDYEDLQVRQNANENQVKLFQYYGSPMLQKERLKDWRLNGMQCSMSTSAPGVVLPILIPNILTL